MLVGASELKRVSLDLAVLVILSLRHDIEKEFVRARHRLGKQPIPTQLKLVDGNT